MTPTPPNLDEKDGLFVRPASYVEPLDLAGLFPAVQPLEVELGSGDGGFLLQWAQAHPERNFLGVERLLGRSRKLDRKGRRARLTNLRVFRLEAGYVLGYLIPDHSVSALHVYFPDPWPKKRHQKNRLVNDAFAESVRRVLEPGGCLHLRTDNEEYYDQMREVFAAATSFSPIDAPPELTAIRTEFETDFNAEGIPTRYASYAVAG